MYLGPLKVISGLFTHRTSKGRHFRVIPAKTKTTDSAVASPRQARSWITEISCEKSCRATWRASNANQFQPVLKWLDQSASFPGERGGNHSQGLVGTKSGSYRMLQSAVLSELDNISTLNKSLFSNFLQNLVRVKWKTVALGGDMGRVFPLAPTGSVVLFQKLSAVNERNFYACV